MPLGNEFPHKTILVVDDEEVIRKLCVRALSQYRTLEAGNGIQALEILRREQVDLVLTDVMMPQMGGIELLQAIKETSPNLVVVIMTGFADKDLILQALKASANDFITKPLSLLQLSTTIAKALEWQHLREELVELKRMDRLKSQFLGLVSHKLKTPSTAISLFLQNLAEGVLDLDTPECRAAMEEARKELRYLDYLVRDLLYYSEVILRDRTLHPSSLQPADLILETLNMLAVEAEERRVDLEVIPPATPLPQMALDREQIAFVLRALLENAIKFTPSGGRVTLGSDVVDHNLRIRIEDNGIGIPPEELTKIFEKFYQVDPVNSGQVRGFGLGLFYARQFVQGHGGSLQITSHAGRGTTATILLPLAT